MKTLKLKSPKNYGNTGLMLSSIFKIETVKEYDQETIDAYEDKYKTFVLEKLADYAINEEHEESILQNYNPENLVNFFKTN